MSMFEKGNFIFRDMFDSMSVPSALKRHMHNEYELYFFLQGNVDYTLGSSLYHLNAGDMLFIRPTVFHFPKILSDMPYHRIYFNFSKEHVHSDLQKNLNDFSPFYHIAKESIIHKLYKNAIYSVERYQDQDKYNVLIKYLNLILTELKYTASNENSKTTMPVHPLLSEILQYIETNLANILSLTSIANEFFVSPSWITHTFHKYMNIGAMQYITRKKILISQQLIENGIPPTEAAERCGFRNYSTFYLQYKKILGTNPAADKSNR